MDRMFLNFDLALKSINWPNHYHYQFHSAEIKLGISIKITHHTLNYMYIVIIIKNVCQYNCVIARLQTEEAWQHYPFNCGTAPMKADWFSAQFTAFVIFDGNINIQHSGGSLRPCSLLLMSFISASGYKTWTSTSLEQWHWMSVRVSLGFWIFFFFLSSCNLLSGLNCGKLWEILDLNLTPPEDQIKCRIVQLSKWVRRSVMQPTPYWAHGPSTKCINRRKKRKERNPKNIELFFF